MATECEKKKLQIRGNFRGPDDTKSTKQNNAIEKANLSSMLKCCLAEIDFG